MPDEKMEVKKIAEAHGYNIPVPPVDFSNLNLLVLDKGPVVWMEQLSPTLVRLEIDNIPTQEAVEICKYILPDVLEAFLKKNRDYGDSTYGANAMRLGPKAQFVDIWRKVKKLKRAIWDGEQLHGEQPEEILQDFLGHVLLALLDYRKDRNA